LFPCGVADGDGDVDTDGEVDGEDDGVADGEADVDADGGADVDADGEADVDTDGEADVDADGEADVDADGEADVDAYGGRTLWLLQLSPVQHSILQSSNWDEFPVTALNAAVNCAQAASLSVQLIHPRRMPVLTNVLFPYLPAAVKQ